MLVYQVNSEASIEAIRWAVSQLWPSSIVSIDYAFDIAYVTVSPVPDSFSFVQALLVFGEHYYRE
jgi:hypothetical protein